MAKCTNRVIMMIMIIIVIISIHAEIEVTLSQRNAAGVLYTKSNVTSLQLQLTQ